MADQTIKVNPMFVKLIIGILALLLGFISVIFVGAGWAIWNNTNNISILVSKSSGDKAQWKKMNRIVRESKKDHSGTDKRLRAVEIKAAFQGGFAKGKASK